MCPGDWRADNARKNFTTHGQSESLTYSSWERMKNRCSNPNHVSYHRYGGRGIKVCERWKKFEHFLEDMGERPGRAYSIERRDTDGDYTPDNCFWLVTKHQARNRVDNRLLSFNGRILCVAEWAERIGIPQARLLARLRLGWSVEKALTTPKQKNGYK